MMGWDLFQSGRRWREECSSQFTLAESRSRHTGAMNAWSLLGAEALVESLVEAGSTFTRGEV